MSRAQAALDTVSGLEKGHTQYLASSEGEFSWRWCVGFLQLELAGVGLSWSRVATQSCVPINWLTLVICRKWRKQGAWSHLTLPPGHSSTLCLHMLGCWSPSPDSLRKCPHTLNNVPIQISRCSHPQPRPYSPADASALVAALTRFSHLAADTIVNGGATSHLAPTDPADRK